MPLHTLKPGQIIPYTAVYNLVDANEEFTGRQEMHEQGRRFPSPPGADECGYKVSHLVKKPKLTGR